MKACVCTWTSRIQVLHLLGEEVCPSVAHLKTTSTRHLIHRARGQRPEKVRLGHKGCQDACGNFIRIIHHAAGPIAKNHQDYADCCSTNNSRQGLSRYNCRCNMRWRLRDALATAQGITPRASTVSALAQSTAFNRDRVVRSHQANAARPRRPHQQQGQLDYRQHQITLCHDGIGNRMLDYPVAQRQRSHLSSIGW